MIFLKYLHNHPVRDRLWGVNFLIPGGKERKVIHTLTNLQLKAYHQALKGFSDYENVIEVIEGY